MMMTLRAEVLSATHDGDKRKRLSVKSHSVFPVPACYSDTETKTSMIGNNMVSLDQDETIHSPAPRPYNPIKLLEPKDSERPKVKAVANNCAQPC